MVTISDRAEAICALQRELQAINDEQLKVAAVISGHISVATHLANRAAALHKAMGALLCK